MGSNDELEESFENSPFMSGAFKISGECEDEIVLVFDDSNKLYASKNFLRYASPVFKAMFDHDFKEKIENCVKLTRKNYDDFLEFLLCIHPRILKPITKKNVLQVVSIADEYQVTSIIKKCKEIMMIWLEHLSEEARSKYHYLHQSEYLRPCLHIVTKAYELHYDNVVKSAVETIAKFGHILYNEGQKSPSRRYGIDPSPSDTCGDETLGEIKKSCMTIFQNLPVEIKFQIAANRLLLLSDMCDRLL